MVRSGWILLAALGAIVVQPDRQAHAAPAPYSDWAFDTSRADETQNLGAFGELVKKKPDFARVWFYGRIFDLTTPGIPDAQKVQLRSRLQLISDILQAAPYSDGLPKLLLDRAQNQTLAKIAVQSRELQRKWMAQMNRGDALPLRLAVVQNPIQARIAFYVLMYRSELAVRRLGGSRDRRRLLAGSRALAEGFALADGDLGPWKALSAFYGTNGLPGNVKGVVEQQVTAAINAYVQGKPAQAKARFETALRTARAARGGSLMVALVMNGAAHASVWLKEFSAAKSLRARVLQGIRPLRLPKLTMLIVQQMVSAYLEEKNLIDIVAYTRELREAGDVVLNDPRALNVMRLAAEALHADADARWSESQLLKSLGSVREAKLIWGVLSDPKVIAVNHVASRVEEIRRDRIARQAKLLRLEGRIAARRGEFEEARKMYGQAIGLYDGLGNLDEATLIETELADAFLSSGNAQETLARTSATQTRLGLEGNAVIRAKNYLVQGRARLMQGLYAKAYGNANYALKVLRNAGISDANKALRAQLHSLAATVLDASGQPMAALERTASAIALAPTDRDIVRTSVVAALSNGDIERALTAIKPLATSQHSQSAVVYQGCALVSSERVGEGVEMLAVIVPQMTLPHLVFENILGRTCLAMGYLKTDRLDEARNAIQHARAKILSHPDPHLVWRIHAIDGALNARNGQWLAATGEWRQAMDRFIDLMGEQSWRGILLNQRTPAQPRGPLALLNRLPESVFNSAKNDSANATTHIQEAIRTSRWLQQWRFSAQHRPYVVDRPRNPTQTVVWKTLKRMEVIKEIISDPAVIRSDRKKLAQTYRTLAGNLREQVAAIRMSNAAEYDYFSPAPRAVPIAKGEAVLRYFVTADTTYLWVVVPGAVSRQYILPGRAALGSLLFPARAVIDSPPLKWDPTARRPKDPNRASWAVLKKPTRVLLPFLKDRTVMAALDGQRIRVIPDGPLMRFPLQALVTKLPPRRPLGQGPTFVGQILDLHYAFLDQAPGVSTAQSTSQTLAGPLLNGSGGCPQTASGDACASALMGGRLAAFQSGLGDKTVPKRLEGAAVTDQQILTAFTANKSLYYFPPVDLMSGTLVTSPAQSGQPYSRLDTDALAMIAGQTKEVFFPTVAGGPLAAENGDGLRRLQAALRASGVESMVVMEGGLSGDDAVWFEYLGRVIRDAGSLASAVRNLQAAAMMSTVDPKAEDQVVMHHPYAWARWMLYSAQPAPAPNTDFVAPLDVFSPKVEEPASPYGDDPAGDTVTQSAKAGGATNAESAIKTPPPIDAGQGSQPQAEAQTDGEPAAPSDGTESNDEGATDSAPPSPAGQEDNGKTEAESGGAQAPSGELDGAKEADDTDGAASSEKDVPAHKDQPSSTSEEDKGKIQAEAGGTPASSGENGDSE